MPGNPISADDLLEWGLVNRFFLSDSFFPQLIFITPVHIHFKLRIKEVLR